jgi:hypothetical protein
VGRPAADPSSVIGLVEEQAHGGSAEGALHFGPLAQAALGAAGESVGGDDLAIGTGPDSSGSRLAAFNQRQARNSDKGDEQRVLNQILSALISP